MDVGSIYGSLDLQDNFTGVLGIAVTKLATASEQLGQLGAISGMAGVALSAGITVPLVAAAAASLELSGSFEATTTRLVSLAGTSSDRLEEVRQHILDLGPAVGVGPEALATAMTKVSSTVSDTSVALQILDMSAKGSAAGLGATVDVAGALTAIINSYGAENITAAHAADILTKAVQDGGAEAKELAPTLANVVPFAAQLGISFEEVAANIATVTKLGVPAAEAVTQLSSVMTALTKETNKGHDALASVGLSYAELRAEVKEKGLGAALIDLTQRFGDNKTALAEVFGRVEALRNIMSSAGQQAEIYTDEITRMKDSAGALDAAFDAMKGTQVQTWAQLSASIDTIAIKFGDALAPAFKAALEALQPVLSGVISLADGFQELPQPMQTVVIVLGAAAAAAGPLLIAFGAITLAVSALAPMLVTEAGALGILSTAWGVLTAEIVLAEIPATVMTGAVDLFSASSVTAAGAVKALWAAIEAHPFIALTAAVGAATVAFVKWYGATQEAALASEAAAAKQDTINAAISHGAKVTIEYADAIAYNTEWAKKLADPLTTINTRLQEMKANGEPATQQLNYLSASVINLSSQGKLGSDQMKKLATEVLSLGVPVSALPPALKAIVTSMDAATKSTAGFNGPAQQTHKQLEEQAAQAKQTADAWKNYSAVGKTAYDSMSAATIEGIKYDKQRGVSNSDLAEVYKVTTSQVEQVVKSMSTEKDAQQKLQDSTHSLTSSAIGAVAGFGAFGHLMPDLSKNAAESAAQFDLLSASVGTFHNGISEAGAVLTNVVIPQLSGLPNVVSSSVEKLDEARAAMFNFGDASNKVLSAIPDLFIKAFTGGGGVEGALKAIGTLIFKEIIEPLTKMSTTSTSASGSVSTAFNLVGIAASAATVGIGLLVSHIVAADSAMKSARQSAKEWSNALIENATAAELAGAGNDHNSQIIAVIRSRYEEMGYSVQEADDALTQLWNAQQDGPEELVAAMNRVNKVFDHQKEITEQIRAQFGPSKIEYQSLADTAKEVYEYMLRTGQYTAEQLAAAFEASADAQRRANGDAAQTSADAAADAGYKTRAELEATAQKAQETYEYMRDSGEYTAAEIQKAWKAAQDAQNEAYDDATSSITDLVNQYQTLADSISDEAPEEVMGVIESQTRGQMAALKAQGEEALKAAGSSAEEAARLWEEALGGISIPDVHVKVKFDIDDLPSGWSGHGGGEAPEPGDMPVTIDDNNHAASGGMVTTSGIMQVLKPRGNDTVGIMAAPGEEILTAQASKEYHNGSGSNNNDIVAAIRDMKADMLHRWPTAVGLKISDALTEVMAGL